MTSSPTRMVVSCVTKNGARFLIFRNTQAGDELAFVLSSRVQSIIDAWKTELPERLQAFHRKAGAIESADRQGRWRLASETMQILRSIGAGALTNIFRDTDDRFRLSRFFRGAFPPASTGRLEKSVIELRFTKHDIDLFGIPIDFFPLLSQDSWRLDAPITNHAELERALSQFVGLGATVVRRLVRTFRPDRKLARVNGRVPIKIIRNKSLNNYDEALEAASDTGWFYRMSRDFAPEPAWPDDNIEQADAVLTIATFLRDARYAFEAGTGPRSFADQIQHFSCHYTADNNGRRLGLRKPRGAIRNLDINLENLEVAIGDLDRNDPHSEKQPGPLVFLNACAAGAVDATKTSSLIETLLQMTDLRAIIVTETPVHSRLAARYARRVYENLLAGFPLYSAMHHARWQLIALELNPFGILYTLYGNPDLYIEATATTT